MYSYLKVFSSDRSSENVEVNIVKGFIKLIGTIRHGFMIRNDSPFLSFFI